MRGQPGSSRENAQNMLTDEEYSYRDELLFCEDTSLSSIAAEFGTPTYVYSTQAIKRNYAAYECALEGIGHQVCYAVKANSNLAVLQILVRLGAGFDIVSAGELYRVLKAGAKAKDVVFSGVGKTASEITYALENGIHSFNCESEAEIGLISEISSRLGVEASIALRVNPDVDAITHPYISTGLREHKFGVDFHQVETLYERAMKLPGLRPEGVSCHIGSQLLDAAPVLEAADKVLDLVGRLRRNGVPIRHVDLGGGLGVRYRPSDRTPSIEEVARCLKSKLAGNDLVLLVEPGRSIVADAGVLLTRVLLTKFNGVKTFVIVDAAMNDLLRPTLYQAHHEISPVRLSNGVQVIEADVVGPVCETGDFLARGRRLPSVDVGDLLAIRTAGAYGFVLSSNYNSRPRACEVLVDRDKTHLARERESWPDLVRGEYLVGDAVSAMRG
jgi:diaminopimelate decarboxylase